MNSFTFFNTSASSNPERIFNLIEIFNKKIKKIIPYGISNLTHLDREKERIINDCLTLFYRKHLQCDAQLYEQLHYFIFNNHVNGDSNGQSVQGLYKKLLGLLHTFKISEDELKEFIRLELATPAAAIAKKEATLRAQELFKQDLAHEDLTPEQHLQYISCLSDAAIKYKTVDCVALCGIAAAFLKLNLRNVDMKLAGPTYYIHYFLIIHDSIIWDVWANQSYPITEAANHLVKLQGKIKPHTNEKHGEVLLGNKKVYKSNGASPLNDITSVKSVNMNDIKLNESSMNKLVSFTAGSIYQSIDIKKINDQRGEIHRMVAINESSFRLQKS